MPIPSTQRTEYGSLNLELVNSRQSKGLSNSYQIDTGAMSLMDSKRFTVKDLPDGSRTVNVKNAAAKSMSLLRQLRHNKNLCDVMFQVAGSEIYAHRCILIINSTYFRSMFTDGFKEDLKTVITLPSDTVTPDAAEGLIDFMYTGSLTVTTPIVQDLIVAADFWEMDDAKDLCIEFMEQHIDTQNCIGLLTFAEQYHCDRLKPRCLQIIKQKFPIVVTSIEFLHLSTQSLENILDFTDLALGTEGEDMVLEALFKWLDFSPQTRAADLPVLLRKVHLQVTSVQCRLKVLGSSTIVQGNEELRRLVVELMLEHREPRCPRQSVYVIGGFREDRTGPNCPRMKGVEYLSTITNTWTQMSDFPMLSSGSFAFSVYGHLLCAAFEPIGAQHANIALQTRIFQYNWLRDEWSDTQDFFSPESLECIDNCLQAEGALAVCSQTNTIYTVSRNEVCQISVNLIDDNLYCRYVRLLPMPRMNELFSQHHRFHSALVMDGRLYVLGGDKHDAGHEVVPTGQVIMFDPDTQTWSALRDMTERRAKMAVVAYNGKIYAIGGFSNTKRLETMERYDPGTDTWESLAPMKYYRTHHQAIVLDNKIWAIGGKSHVLCVGGARKVISLCDIYDPETDTWTDGPPMKSGRCGFAAVVV